MKPIRTILRDAGITGGWRAVGATLSRPHLRPRPSRARGFTLTEVLIVIGLIVLLIALAVPAFNAMTGGRSVDAAINQLSAMLGRARMEAIGLQEPRGLMFYRDPATGRVAARLVKSTVATSTGLDLVNLDLVEKADPMLLPVGVAIQMVDDSDTSKPSATDDRYLGYNFKFGASAPTFQVAIGGVILFDQTGRLVSRPYGLVDWTLPEAGTSKQVTEMGKFLFGTKSSPTGVTQVITPNTTANPTVLRSQFGFVVYDEETFSNQGFSQNDPQLGGAPGSQPETAEETWLDTNAVPVLINRYNGTIVRGE